jgi:hypothetical protein
LHRAAEDVEREHRRGQQQPLRVHALELGNRDTFAARDTHEVCEQQVHETNLRVAAEPGGRLPVLRELRHEGPRCLGFSDGCAAREPAG